MHPLDVLIRRSRPGAQLLPRAGTRRRRRIGAASSVDVDAAAPPASGSAMNGGVWTAYAGEPHLRDVSARAGRRPAAGSSMGPPRAGGRSMRRYCHVHDGSSPLPGAQLARGSAAGSTRPRRSSGPGAAAAARCGTCRARSRIGVRGEALIASVVPAPDEQPAAERAHAHVDLRAASRAARRACSPPGLVAVPGAPPSAGRRSATGSRPSSSSRRRLDPQHLAPGARPRAARRSVAPGELQPAVGSERVRDRLGIQRAACRRRAAARRRPRPGRRRRRRPAPRARRGGRCAPAAGTRRAGSRAGCPRSTDARPRPAPRDGEQHAERDDGRDRPAQAARPPRRERQPGGEHGRAARR